MESYPVMKKLWKKAKIVKGEPFIAKKCMKCKYDHLLKPDAGWFCKNGYSNKTLFYKDNLHLIQKGKLNTIKETFSMFNTNESRKIKAAVLKTNVIPSCNLVSCSFWDTCNRCR